MEFEVLACKIFVTISYKKMKICSALSNTTLEQNIRVRQIFQLPLLLMECLWIYFFDYQRDAARDVDTSREKTGLKQYLPPSLANDDTFPLRRPKQLVNSAILNKDQHSWG
ncbi:uncharacterized protein LOC116165961 [Photinus pyralis]|uniref:Uncharacterized protein n=1 Tax=Photinus pyralis TaxID=7054 RepID=A0A1Y1K6I3_PHOPY|nr:uncharacterized protein LOC116165961 [Photinus pyralis]